jgi:hypothetical protein
MMPYIASYSDRKLVNAQDTKKSTIMGYIKETKELIEIIPNLEQFGTISSIVL